MARPCAILRIFSCLFLIVSFVVAQEPRIIATNDPCDFRENHNEATTATASTSSPRLGRYSALACWLQKLKIPLPNQSFKEGIIRLSLKDFVCSNFSIAGLDSAYQQQKQGSSDANNNSTTNSELKISLKNVSAICQGTYHSSGLSGNVQAMVGASHANTPALRFSWNVQAEAMNHSFVQPVAVHTADCQTAVAVTDLHFSGSISARTIQLFVKQIRSSLTKALSTELCPLLSKTLEPTFDHYIELFNHWIEPYLSRDDDIDSDGDKDQASRMNLLPGKSAAVGAIHPMPHMEMSNTKRTLLEHHHSPKKERMHWTRDAPALMGFLRMLNQGLDYFLQQGLLQHWLPIFDQQNKPHSCGFLFDGINSLIRSLLYDNDGWVDLPLLSRWEHLHFVIPKYAAIQLQIKNISVHGLDHWDALELFSPASEESFVTRLDLHNVTLRTRLHLTLSAVADGAFKGDDLEENFIVDFNATTFNTFLQFYLDADKTALNEKVTVGTVWDVLEGVLARNSSLPQLPCLIAAIDTLAVSSLAAHWKIQSLAFQPDFNGKVSSHSLEEDLDGLINNAMQIVWSEFPEMVTQGINGLMQGPALEALNDFFDRIMTTNETCTVPNHKGYSPHVIDFTNVGWLGHMNDFFARSSTKRHIDSYLQCGADYMAVALKERIPNSLVQIESLDFQNIGHLQELKFLSPLPDGHSLSNGFLFASADRSYLPSLDINLKVALPQISIETNASLQWNDIGASSGLALHYDLGRLKQYPLTQVLEHGQCLVVPANELDVYGVTNELETFSVKLDAFVDYGVEPVYLNWTSSNTPEVEAVVAGVWAWAVNSSRDTAILVSLAAMSQAGARCQGKEPAYDDERSGEDYLSITLVVCAIILLAQPAVLMIHGENDERAELRRRAEEQEQYENALMQPTAVEGPTASPTGGDGSNQSLMEHRNISDVTRVVIPVLIVCTFTLLICSNLSVGADVTLKASVPGQTLEIPSIFSFSLFNTAKEMLQAKIYSLLLLVAVFSGLWPYLKLCLMLMGWLIRLSKRNIKRRGRMFLALDALGKFSLVDTYVLVLMVVAFRYHLEIEGGVTLDVFVAPKFGFSGFLVATVLSLVLSHALVYFHRRAEVLVLSNTGEESSRLLSHHYQMQIGRKQLSSMAVVLVLGIFLITFALLAVGMTRESFIFEFGGVAGDLIGQRKDAAYSLLSIGQALPGSVEQSSGFAIIGLQIAYFFFAVASPFACLILLFVLFAFPLTLRRKFVFLTCAEIANAWSAVEVFCLSIVAAVFEISTFASFIVGDKCDIVDSILQNNFDEAADTCYSVDAFVSWSATYLVLGAVMNSALVSVALRFAHIALEEQLERNSPRLVPVDSLAAPKVGFVEWLAGMKGMGWALCSPPECENEVEPLVDDVTEESHKGQDKDNM